MEKITKGNQGSLLIPPFIHSFIKGRGHMGRSKAEPWFPLKYEIHHNWIMVRIRGSTYFRIRVWECNFGNFIN